MAGGRVLRPRADIHRRRQGTALPEAGLEEIDPRGLRRGGVMVAIDIVLSGLILGGTYALIALGLTLQYGVARIMNLAYGELLIAAAFAAFWLFTSAAVNPLLGLLLVVPAAFAICWAIYRFLLTPLVARAPNRDALEVDSILATFG